MNDLTLICDDCGQPVVGDTGYLYVTYADIHAAREAAERRREVTKPGAPVNIMEFMLAGGPALWRVTHDRHRPSDDAYYIDAVRFDSWRKVAHWTAHLMEKNWLQHTDWDYLLRELAGDIPAKRVRVTAREAA